MERTIELTIRDGFSDAVGGIMHGPASGAIGYLSAWSMGNTRIKLVKIHGDSEGNLWALYLGSDGKLVYEIGGIMHKNDTDGSITYSFHS